MVKFYSEAVRVYLDGYDVGTATRRVMVRRQQDALDPTSLGDTAEKVIAGLRRDAIEWDGLFDDGTSMDAAALNILASGTRVVSVLMGSATGSVAYSGQTILLTNKPAGNIGELVTLGAELGAIGTIQRGGIALVRTTIAGAGSSGQVDNTTATTNGGTLYIHVFSYSGTGSGSIFFRGRATSTGAYTDLVSLTGITTATGTVLTFTGTAHRFTEVAKDTPGTMDFAVTFIRS